MFELSHINRALEIGRRALGRLSSGLPRRVSRPAKVPFAARRAAHLRLGRRGETLALRFLREQGLDILTRNYRTTTGEIDLVARESDCLCFVEVKTRAHAVHSRPADAVGRHKRGRIVKAAHRYLREIGHPPILYRFDIVEIVLRGRRVFDARYWRRAFTEREERGGLRFPSVRSARLSPSGEA